MIRGRADAGILAVALVTLSACGTRLPNAAFVTAGGQGQPGAGTAQAEGIQTVYESGGSQGENLEAPNWDADVLAMRTKGADVVFDAVDDSANEKICASMDRYGVHVKAKVSTIEVWSQQVGTSAWSSPCRDSIYSSDAAVSYADTNVGIVAQFRHDYATYAPGKLLHQWALDAYGAGLVFEDAASALGANLTRQGFIGCWMRFPSRRRSATGDYTAHGIFTPLSWQPYHEPTNVTNCNTIVKWQDRAGTFVNRSPSGEFVCYVTGEVGVPFTNDGS